MTINKKPTGGHPAGSWGVDNINLFTPIVPTTPKKDNPHVRDVRREAEILLNQAETPRSWSRYQRHFMVCLAVLEAEARRGQL